MIKTENDLFYMTAGETCYIARSAEGRLSSVWFGARVEPEDSLLGLGITAGGGELYVDSGTDGQTDEGDFEQNIVIDKATGERAEADFRIVGYSVEQKDCFNSPFPVLVGGKTLCVTLCDNRLGLSARLFYTPYPRGGFSRRLEITNTGKRTLSFRAGLSIELLGKLVPGKEKNGAVNYISVVEPNGNAAYAFVALYGGAALMFSADGGQSATVGFTLDENTVLKPGESFGSPELLCVFSDSGEAGASRVIHDILREACDLEGRAPVTLSVPCLTVGSASSAADCAGELGADVLIVPFDGTDEAAIAKTAQRCKDNGITFGLRFGSCPSKRAELDKKVLFDARRGKKTAVDFGRPEAVDAVFDIISRAVKSYGAEYIAVSDFVCRDSDGYGYMLGLYGLLKKLRAAFPELYIEGPPDCGSLCLCSALTGKYGTDSIAALPPRSLVFRVDVGDGSLKTKFDLASLGCLGYEFDPDALTDDIKRAIRAQILSFQDDALTVADGDLYEALGAENSFVAVAKDKSGAFSVCMRDTQSDIRVRLLGLDVHGLYRVRELDGIFSGAALSSVGIKIPRAAEPGTYTFHLRQVADYE